MKAPIHGLAVVVLLAAMDIALVACGIDTFATLANDPVAKSYDSTSLQFLGPVPGDASYLGVELFYRIYDSSTDAETDRAYVLARQSAENTVPGSVIKSYLTAATPGGLNYLNPVLVNPGTGSKIDSIPTLLDADLGSGSADYYVNIAFPTDTGTEPKLEIFDGIAALPTVAYTSRRNVTDAGTYKYFKGDEPVSGDADFRTNSGDVDRTYYVQFFAASYGIDFTSFSELYGDAVFLGLITLSFE